jgi:molybdopterin converting factor small subunit
MGKLVKEVLVAGDGLDPKFKIFVNGNVTSSLHMKLADGDEVLLFGIIDGG